MNVHVKSLAPGARSMPAEFRSPGGWGRLKAGMHGMGTDGGDSDLGYDLSDVGEYDTSTAGDTVVLPGGASYNPGSSTLTPLIGNPSGPVYTPSSSSPTLAQTTSAITSAVNPLTQLMAVLQGGAVTNSGIYGSAGAAPVAGTIAASSALTSLLPILLLGGGAILVISILGKK